MREYTYLALDHPYLENKMFHAVIMRHVSVCTDVESAYMPSFFDSVAGDLLKKHLTQVSVIGTSPLTPPLPQ